MPQLTDTVLCLYPYIDQLVAFTAVCARETPRHFQGSSSPWASVSISRQFGRVV